MTFVDSHCHLIFSRVRSKGVENDPKYGVDAIIKRALEANVKYMLTIGTELTDVAELQAITTKYSSVFRTVGVHPLEAAAHHERYDDDEISKVIEDSCADAKTVGIGEIGFDYHYEKESQKQQDKLFNLQLDLAKRCCLPVVVHAREASEDVVDALKNHAGVAGVIHCFSGEKYFAQRCLDLGFYLSISGNITYKNSAELQDTIRYIPLDRLLIETDSPALAPVPLRGKLNEPAFVVHVADKISQLLQISPEKVASSSFKNFFNLFSKAKDFLDSESCFSG
jgi:TatD DNase family protein